LQALKDPSSGFLFFLFIMISGYYRRITTAVGWRKGGKEEEGRKKGGREEGRKGGGGFTYP